MARTKKAARRKTGGNGDNVLPQSGGNQAGPSKPVDVQGLIDKAHTLLAQSNFDLAIKFLHRALEVEPANLEAREVLGIAELEGGDEDAGREHLLRLFPPHTPSPPSHPSPYLYLAQTAVDPHEALGYYSTAAAMIENALSSSEGSTVNGAGTEAGKASAGHTADLAGQVNGEVDPDEEMRAMGVRALVAMIEIWMSDLCMEPEAETNCDALILRAIAVASTDAEVQLTLASIRMSQSRTDEAKEVILGVYERIKDLDAFAPALPPLPTRLLLARQLLEHEQHLAALDVLQVAREEDSQEVESAYLEGWAFYLRAKAVESATTGGAVPANADSQVEADDVDLETLTAGQCLSESFRALIEAAQLFADQDYPDEGIGAHLGELLEELKGLGVVPAIVEEEEEGEGEGEGQEGEGDWEDVEMK